MADFLNIAWESVWWFGFVYAALCFTSKYVHQSIIHNSYRKYRDYTL